MIKNKDTIIPVNKDVECIAKKSCNDHHDNKEIILINNKRRNVVSNKQNSITMDDVNTKIIKLDTQLPPQQYHQNNLSLVKGYKYRKHANDQYYFNKKYIRDNHLLSEQSLPKYDMPENEDQIKNNIYDLENTNIDNSEHESITMIAKTQKNKTAISLLNEWAMRGDGTKPFVVSYVLMAITGHAHKPIFTYMCQIDNIKALGKGKSKKEAKQNAAAQMCKKHFDFKIDFLNDNDKIITSTTTTDNFEANENDTFLSSNEGSQIIDVTNSDVGDKELQQFKYEEVQIAYSDMNPVGALQELCTTHKWIPPFYNVDILNKDQRECKTVLYKVICEVFHLQTMGIASVKKEAKRKAARLMFEKIFDIGTEKLNELRSLYPITLSPTEDYEQNKCNIIYNEENQKLSNKWFSAYCFRSYITETIAAKTKTNGEAIIPLIENKDNPTQLDQQLELYITEIEQYIEDYDPTISNVNKLDTLCKELRFQTIYVCLGVQKKEDIKNNIGQDEEYAVLVQVTSLPVTVTTGYGATADIAAEEAAKSILQTFKAMLLFTKPATINLNNNEEEKIVNKL